MIRSSLVFVLCILMGCSGSDNNDYSKLGDFKVLALPLNTPEVNPGDEVILTPFISDYNGNGRSLTYHLSGCSVLSTKITKRPDCDGASDREVFVEKQAVSGLSGPSYTGSMESIKIRIPATFLLGTNSIDQYNGLKYRLILEIREALNQELLAKATKDVVVSSRSNKNKNPVISSILSSGEELKNYGSSVLKLKVKYDKNDQERYELISSSGQRLNREEFWSFSWFGAHGSFSPIKSYSNDDEVEWTPPASGSIPSGQRAVVVLVARDGRGGESVLKLEL